VPREDSLTSAKFRVKSNFQKWLELINTWEFYFEFTILAIHPIPYYEYAFKIDIIDMMGTKKETNPCTYLLCSDFLFAAMCMRIYFLVRTMMNFSVFAELYSKRICVKYGFEQDTSFCLKAMMTKSAGKTVLLVCLISVMWFAYVLRIFERYSINKL
jgi:hypothetical protein